MATNKKSVAKKSAAPKATKKTSAKKGAAPAKKAAAKSSPAMEMLLVGSKSKEVLKAHGLNVAGDALEGLNALVYWYLDQAAKRAQANGRKTVRKYDFMAD